MLQATLRWMLPLIALLAIGPLAWLMTGPLRGPDGGHETTLLLSSTPVLGLIRGVVALMLAGVTGLATARLIGSHYGLFSAGLVLAWAAWGTGSLDGVARAQTGLGITPAPSPSAFFVKLALEGAVLAPIAAVWAWAIVRFARTPVPTTPGADQSHATGSDGQGQQAGHSVHPEPTTLRDTSAAVGLVAAMAAGALFGWLVAQESLKGQTIAAASFAGLFGAVAGRLTAVRICAAVFVLGVGLLGVVGPISALVVGGSGSAKSVGALEAAASGLAFNLARPMPLDWLAGAFIGAPIGLSWAMSMIDHHHPQPAGGRSSATRAGSAA